MTVYNNPDDTDGAKLESALRDVAVPEAPSRRLRELARWSLIVAVLNLCAWLVMLYRVWSR